MCYFYIIKKDFLTFQTFKLTIIQKSAFFLIAIYALILTIIGVFIYEQRYNWSLWMRHAWTGFGAPFLVVLALSLFLALNFRYLINRKTRVWLFLILLGIFAVTFVYYLFPVDVTGYFMLKHGDMAYYTLARSHPFDNNLLELIRNYLDSLKNDHFPGYGFQALRSHIGTHPPGPVALFVILEKIMLWLNSNYHLTIQEHEANIVAFLKIILNTFSLIPIYLLGAHIGNKKVGALAACFFILSPALYFFFQYPDTFNIFLFTSAFLFLVMAEKNSRYLYLSAVMTLLATFMSFGYFLFYPLFALWLLIRLVQRAIKPKLFYRAAMIYGLSLVLWYFFCRQVLNYDFLIGWQLAESVHQNITGGRGFGEYYWLNYLDVIQFAGWPISLLFLASLWLVLKRKLKDIQGTLAVFAFAALVMINSLGITRGEVGRIWFFLYPLIFISAAIYLDSRHKLISNLLFMIAFVGSLILSLLMRASIYTVTMPPGYF